MFSLRLTEFSVPKLGVVVVFPLEIYGGNKIEGLGREKLED